MDGLSTNAVRRMIVKRKIAGSLTWLLQPAIVGEPADYRRETFRSDPVQKQFARKNQFLAESGLMPGAVREAIEPSPQLGWDVQGA